MNEKSVVSEGMSHAGPSGSGTREQNAIYQMGKLVARVVHPELDLEAKEIRFDEIVDSDHPGAGRRMRISEIQNHDPENRFCDQGGSSGGPEGENPGGMHGGNSRLH